MGVYMKNWSKDLPGFTCPWKEDYQDAKRIAVQLGIDFQMFDFEKEYFEKVVRYMLDGFKTGITPNPDIMCNQEVKFKLFLNACLKDGADYIATGHYAKTKNGKLYMSKDKDSGTLAGFEGLSSEDFVNNIMTEVEAPSSTSTATKTEPASVQKPADDLIATPAAADARCIDHQLGA